MAKKYFWLKLKDDFFRDKRIKKLRRVAGGDTYTLIYLKLQLLSLKNEGKLYFEGVEDEFHKELALEIDEDETNVQFTVMFLMSNGLLEECNENEFALIETINSIGSETDIAARVRKHRELKTKKENLLQCNDEETNGNTDIYIEKDLDKEKNKEKEVNKKQPSTKAVKSPKYDDDSPYLVYSKMLYQLIVNNGMRTKQPDFEKWADEIRLLNEKDGVVKDLFELKNVIIFSQNDDFWKQNILSTKKLREHYDKLINKMNNAYKPRYQNKGHQPYIAPQQEYVEPEREIIQLADDDLPF